MPTEWLDALGECAELRCPYAADRVATAEAPPAVVLVGAEGVLIRLLEAGDVPALATLVGTLEPLLDALGDRRGALAWHDRWRPLLAGLGRCDRANREVVCCPACRRREPCPLDVWPRYLARTALGLPEPGSGAPTGVLKSFLHLNGTQLGQGVLTTWLRAERRLLAEATAWLVHEEHRQRRQAVAAQSFAHLAWKAGAREPRLAAAFASVVARPGDEAALRRAADICAEALAARDGSTFDGWTELGAKHAQLLGRLGRIELRASRELDEDGNPVPVRRHHPSTPRRTRPRRFSLEQ